MLMLTELGRLENLLVERAPDGWENYFIETSLQLFLDINSSKRVIPVVRPASVEVTRLPENFRKFIKEIRSICGDDVCLILENDHVIMRSLDFKPATSDSAPQVEFCSPDVFKPTVQVWFEGSDCVGVNVP